MQDESRHGEEKIERRDTSGWLIGATIALALAGVAAFLYLTREAPAPPAPPPAVLPGGEPFAFEVHRSVIATLPAAVERKGLMVFSRDGADFAIPVREETEGGSSYVFTRQGAGPRFAECASPSFDPRGRLYYWCKEERVGASIVNLIADGEIIPTELADYGGLSFSKDGSRFAYGGRVATPDAPEGADLAPVAVVVDRREIGRYLDVTLPAFSPDGRRFAFLYEDEAAGIHLVVDGVVARDFPPPADASLARLPRTPGVYRLHYEFFLQYLSDGTLAMLVQDADGWAVYHGEKRLASYKRNNWSAPGESVVSFGDPASAINADSLVAAEAAPVLAWWERVEGEASRWRVMRNGQPEAVECILAWEQQKIVLSADGKHVAYGCTQSSPAGDQAFFVYDGQRFGPYVNLWGLTLSPDGQHFAFLADDGAEQRSWKLVVDGQERRERFDKAWPVVFSADSKHIAWVGARSDRAVLFLDGHGIVSTDTVLHPPRFATVGTLSWIATRGRRMTLVVAKPKK